MAEYVDRNRLKEAIREDALNCLSCYNGEVLDLVLMDIDEVPAADVRPVVRGRWIKQNDDPLDGNFYCSACHSGIDIATGSETPIDRKMFFCPNCGADMREETNCE